jgi:AcrR family transcriptional regulator
MALIHHWVNYLRMLVQAAPPPELRTRDADRSQQAILRAAMSEFSEHGLGGARVDAIAERAGVNKRLIYYYFGSKEALFLAALETTYTDIREAERALRLESLEPAEAVRRLVAFTWQHYLAHPEFLTLLNAENMHRAKHLKQAKGAPQMRSPLVQMLGDILERGRRAGVFRGGVDPLHLYISIAGLAYFYLSNNATLSTIFRRDLMTQKALSERLSHITEVVMGYLLRET